MSSKSSVLLAVVCLTAGLGIGLAWPRAENESTSASPLTNSVVPRVERLETRAVQTESTVPALERLRVALKDKKSPDLLACWAAISELTATECREALELARKPETIYTQAFLEGIALRWSSLDSEGAFEEILRGGRNDQARSVLSKHAGAALVERDFGGALAQLDRIPAGRSRQIAGQSILLAAAKVDPRRTAEFVGKDKRFLRDLEIATGVAGELARVSPEEALKWVAAIPDRTVREQAESRAWQNWATADPASVATRLPENEKKRVELLEVIGESWMRSDPVEAIKWMNSLTNRSHVQRAMRMIEIDIEEIGEAKARELIAGAKDTTLRNHLVLTVTHGLAGRDVQKAFTFLNEFDGGDTFSHARRSVVNEWVIRDPGGAAQYLLGLPESKEKAEVLRYAIGSWGFEELENVTSFVQQMPAGKDRDVAMAQVVHMLSEDEPAKGLSYLRTIEDPELAGQAARALLGAMVKTDPQSAAAIAAQLPEGAQAAAFAGLVGNWVEENPRAAGEWINTLAPGDGRDSAVHSYVNEIREKDPATATHWAMTIEEPKKRVEATMSSFQRWADSNTDAASEWLNGTEIPEGLRPFFEEELQQAQKAKENGFE